MTLPAGFVLDQESDIQYPPIPGATQPVIRDPRGAYFPHRQSGGLPNGFVLDQEEAGAAPRTGGLTVVPKGGQPQSQLAQAIPSEESAASDIAKSALTGLEKGAMGIVGLPGDIIKGARWAAEKVGLPTVKTPVPGYSELQQEYEKAGGPVHEPKSTLGHYAETLGEFVPAAFGGGGSIARKAAQVVIPAVASETAGQATKGTAAEPYARLAAGLGGIGIATLAKRGAEALPSATALKTEARQYYDAVDKSGVRVNPDVYRGFLQEMSNALNKNRLAKIIPRDPQLAPVRAFFSAISDELKTNGSPTLTDLHSYKELADHLRQSPNPTVRAVGGSVSAAFRKLGGKLDDTMLQGPPNIDVKTAFSFQRKADELWGRAKKAELMDQTFHLADLRKQNYGQAGHEHALRIQFGLLARHLAKSPKDAGYFTPKERQAIDAVATGGGKLHEALRNVGKLAPRGSITAGILGYLGSVFPYLVVPAWGTAELAKEASKMLTAGNAARTRRLLVTGQMPTRRVPLPPVGSTNVLLPLRDINELGP